MRYMLWVYPVVGIFLVVNITSCFCAQEVQPQGPAQEPKKVEQPANNKAQLNRELFTAVMQDQQAKAEELIARGADVNAKFARGISILHVLVIQGIPDKVVWWLAKGAFVDAKDNQGCTPLHWVSGAVNPKMKRNPEIVKILVGNGADVNAIDNKGWSPLHHAVNEGLECIVKALIDSSPDVNVQDKFGLTPLHYGVEKGRKEIVVMLLKRDATIDIKDNAGRTALHYAAGAGHSSAGIDFQEFPTDVVELLLNDNANINAQDNVGWTALHYAVSMREKSIVEMLLSRGADLSIINNRGETAYAWNRQRASFDARHSINTPHQLVNVHNEIAKILHGGEGVYVVSPDGRNGNPGTFERPFKTIIAALEVVGPGDVIYIRGGMYRCDRSIRLDKSGARGTPISLRAYSGEVPILNFSDVRGDSLFISGAYWHLKGLTIVNGYYGVMVWGPSAQHNVLEKITVRNDGWGGILARDGAAYNIFLNCDSHHNFDPESNGDTCDGFSVAFYVGQGNTYIGNRSWNNSDDGYDCWRAGETVRFERCYAWNNGENIWNHPFFFGNGNGFKLGGGGGRHVLIDCFAWVHTSGAGAGFTLNGNAKRFYVNSLMFCMPKTTLSPGVAVVL